MAESQLRLLSHVIERVTDGKCTPVERRDGPRRTSGSLRKTGKGNDKQVKSLGICTSGWFGVCYNGTVRTRQ
jgi:hypothetical protein